MEESKAKLSLAQLESREQEGEILKDRKNDRKEEDIGEVRKRGKEESLGILEVFLMDVLETYYIKTS